MNNQRTPPDLNALERLDSFLKWDNYLHWSDSFNQKYGRLVLDGTPLLEEEQFQMELEVLINDVLNELYEAIKVRYSDSKEHSERAKFYGFRLRRILDQVQQSSALKYYEGIVESQFKSLEKRVSHHLGLDLAFSESNMTHKYIDSEKKGNGADSQSDDTEKYRAAIRKHFGYWTKIHPQDGQIMSEADFMRFTNLLLDSLSSKKAPTDVAKFPKLKATSNGIIRGKFYDLHSELYGTSSIHDFFIDFMREVFQQMHNVDKGKFSVKPKKYPRD